MGSERPARGLQDEKSDFILGSFRAESDDRFMTQVALRQPRTAKLYEALTELKRAADDRRHLREDTPEYARALELEERLTRTVYSLASGIEEERPADRSSERGG